MNTQNYYYSGQGSLYLAERSILGVPTGFVRVGNVPELTIDIATTIFEHKESESGARGIDLTITKENKGTFAFKMENLSLDNLAIGLYGTKAVIPGGSVVDEPHQLYLDKNTPLDHPDVSSVVLKVVAATKVVNVDYTIGPKNGTVAGVTGGSIPDDTTVLVSYNYAQANRLDAFTVTAPERWLRFNGLNTIDGTKTMIDIFRAKLDPLTGYALINDELASASMKGTVLADLLRITGSKYFRQWNIAA
jgi:hypothetical protein